jgi:hypothetical protein
MQSFGRSASNEVEMRVDEAAAILRDVQFLHSLAASEENTRTSQSVVMVSGPRYEFRTSRIGNIRVPPQSSKVLFQVNIVTATVTGSLKLWQVLLVKWSFHKI